MIGALISAAIAYLLGSIPFGLLLTHFAGLGDIRDIGSGNIGATNVLRTGNKKLAIATLFLDGFKGWIAVVLIKVLFPAHAEIAALAALSGHIFPVWLHFKGGKGVATGIGVMLALEWPIGITMLVVWLIMAKRFKISSLSALTAFAVTPIAALVCGRADLCLFALLVAALIFYTHRSNIRRLMNHSEPKIGHRGDIPHAPATSPETN